MAHARNDGLIIEPVRPQDLEAIVRLNNMMGPRHRCDAEDPRTREVFDLYVEGDRKACIVARLDGEVVGAQWYDFAPVFAPTHLHARGDGLAVDPAHQQLGIAGRLIDAGLDVVARRGATSFLARSSQPRVLDRLRRMDAFQEIGAYFYHDPDPSLLD